MKKVFASVLAVSMAITGLHTTSYATGDTPMVSIETQKSNPYMSEIDKELEDFFAKYNAENDYSKKEKLLDTAINEVQSKIDSHAHLLNVMEDGSRRRKIENKAAALKLKHSILSTVKTKKPPVLNVFASMLGMTVVSIAGSVAMISVGAAGVLIFNLLAQMIL